MKSAKSVSPFWEPLFERLIEQIAVIQKEAGNNLQQRARKSIVVCSELMNELQTHILNHNFSSQEEEIFFFKEVKPKFYGRLIYFHKLYNIEVGLPVGGSTDVKAHFQKELDKIRIFFEENRFYYSYHRNQETFLDDKLFTRSRQGVFLTSHIYDINANPAFSTKYDYVFSRIFANELLSDYISKKLLDLTSESNPASTKESTLQTKSITWTDSKVALIELAYAFKSKGVFSNGNATLKDITDFLQSAFNIELTNPSRDFQEILRRKTGYTSFLDNLRESYLKFIDTIESKDRR
jgi:hypothetical protein